MESLDDSSSWKDFLDHTLIDQNSSPDLFLATQSGGVDIDFSASGDFGSQEIELARESDLADFDFSSGGFVSQEIQHTRKRARSGSCKQLGTKACREKLRRERLNDRFLDLSCVLEPGRPARTDKPAILDDAIRVINQLRTEGQELKDENEKLQEEIKSLKAEKNELREEKILLKADKERVEQRLKAMAIPSTGYLQPHPMAYHAGMNKMPVFPSYGLVPMWQYLPPSSRDTSHDHELRPPAA
ncbi:hypothetical protein Q3G72_001062 [Acer saccharum]|nr:hypothetical protein Q3G72_001062 [Acer saccharum]